MVIITGKKILIVEDEAIVALELEYRLKAMGYFVCGKAPSGDKAISLVKETNPNLVLMDINLRGRMNGIETADIIKTNYSIPSLFVTAYSDENTISQIKNSMNNEYLFKPFAVSQLQGAIEKVISMS
jgi:DNA-binding NarL/FixJ family response regulator